MKFYVEYTSDWTGEKSFAVEISSMEELIKFVEDHGKIIIHDGNEIEIYDYYRE